MQKTEFILFKTKQTRWYWLKAEVCRKRLYKAKYLRYLRIKIDKNLNWKIHIHDLVSKLNRANAVLVKLRYFVNSEILRSPYFTIFHSHSNYVCIAWGLHDFLNKKCLLSKKKHLELYILRLLILTLHLCSKIVIFWSLLIYKCWKLHFHKQLF